MKGKNLTTFTNYFYFEKGIGSVVLVTATGLLFTVTLTNTKLLLMNCMIGESNSDQCEQLQ